MSKRVRLSTSGLTGIIFVIVVSVVCHIFFSSLGYNPSDDGFILSGARRILLGEIPHKDFISIRPIFSYLIHIPIVYLGGEYTYWISRLFVWIQFTVIAWIFVLIVETVLKTRFSPSKKIIFGLFAFIYGVYDFPIMAWYSIDAVFLSILGLWFSLQDNSYKKFLGYFLIGLSPITRQNFILVGPIILLILGDYKKIKYWFAYLLPLIIMGLSLLIMGALPDAITQLTTHAELFQTGFLKYYRTKAFLQGFTIGLIAVYFYLAKAKVSFLKKNKSLQTNAGSLLLFAGLFYSAFSMLRPDTYYHTGAFFIMGMTISISIFLFLEQSKLKVYTKIGATFGWIAWSVSISLGHNTPGLATGGFVVFLLAFLTTRRRFHFLAICFILTPALLIFIYIRKNQIYLEQSAGFLTYRLDGVYPGGNNIRTNERTYAFLLDLQKAVKKVGKREFVILPDLAGYWAAAPQKNPLPIDWPTGELHSSPLMDRVISVLKKKRGRLTIIMQKVNAMSLANTYDPVDSSSSALLIYVSDNYAKIGETYFYTLYE